MSDKDDRADIDETIDSVMEAFDKVSDVAEQFGLVGDANSMASTSHDIDPPEPIVESHVDEDEVVVVAEKTGEKIEELGVNFKDETLELIMGKDKARVGVPDDIVEDSISADMKNGVLRVTIDREVEDDDADVEIDFDSDSIEDDTDNDFGADEEEDTEE